MIVAQQQDNDFPATFTFNVIFDVKANNRTVFRNFRGRPDGRNFQVVPPDGKRENSPMITNFETTQIVIQHPEFGPIRFIPRDCNDQKSITVN